MEKIPDPNAWRDHASDYERGFIDGMQKQAQSSVDKAVNAMSWQAENQGPVAWGVFEGNLHDMFFTQKDAKDMARLKGDHAEVKPLYATPQPQREWVGLTEEDVYPLANKYLHYQIEDYLSSGIYNLARAIDATLKEKNRG